MRACNYSLRSTLHADATILDVWSATRKLSRKRASRKLARLVTGSRPCGSDDLKLMNRQVQVRWHRSPHFGSAACSQGSAPWSRWKCAQEETGSVRVHLLPGGTDEHTFCGDRAELALLGHSSQLPL